jgi:hypothetical protein
MNTGAANDIRSATMLGATTMRALLLAILMAVAGCQGQQATSSERVSPATNELDVLVAYLQQNYDNCIKSNTPLVIQDTFSVAMLHMGGRSYEAFTKSLLAEASERVPADLIRDFCARNANSQRVWPELQTRLRVVLLSRKELELLFSSGQERKPDGWDRFYSKYPGSPGIITISRVGFNRTGDRAMLYVGSQNHWLAGHGRIYVFHKKGGKWECEPAYIGPSWVS